MSKLHLIRLHGPWEARVIEGGDAAASASNDRQRVKIPSDWKDWLGPQFRGRVSYQRNFRKPTNLVPAQKVWLVVEAVDYRANVSLNQLPLGEFVQAKGLRVEISEAILPLNRLEIVVELPPDAERRDRTSLAGGLIGEVRLEIEEQA